MNAPSGHYRQPVLEALCAFVRDNAMTLVDKDKTKSDEKVVPQPPPTDIQAALTVIGRRAKGSGVVDLSGANLIGADLSDADLNDAILRHADLSDAILAGADLRDAILRGADLSDAFLAGADLRGAHLIDAELTNTDLRDAILRGARTWPPGT
jgi:hypothetical protein